MANSTALSESIFLRSRPFHVDLASIDARHPVHYSRRVLIFRCVSRAQSNQQLENLKAGLESLVLRCPILGGTVVSLPADEVRHGQEDWRTIAPGPGLELVVRDLRTEMASFAELEAASFPASRLPYSLLMPVPENIASDRPFAACKVQFSAINGGTILTWAMSHSVADGTGNNELTRVLGAEMSRIQALDEGMAKETQSGLETESTSMGLDRSLMRNITSDIPFDIEDHPAYMRKGIPSTVLSPQDRTPPHPFQATSAEVPILLRISTASLAQLKADATTLNGLFVSTHDALTALLWRTVILIRSRRSTSARTLLSSTKTSIFMPSDARRQLNIPRSYIVNAVYQLSASLDIGTLLSPSGLRHAASAIRAAITAATPTLVRSLMAKTNENWIDWAFLTTFSTTGVAMGTDWTSAELYGQDWGKAFGSLIRYRYPGEGGLNCVMPKLPDGAAEVFVSVMPQEVEVAEGVEGFGKYMDARTSEVGPHKAGP